MENCFEIREVHVSFKSLGQNIIRPYRLLSTSGTTCWMTWSSIFMRISYRSLEYIIRVHKNYGDFHGMHEDRHC